MYCLTTTDEENPKNELNFIFIIERRMKRPPSIKSQNNWSLTYFIANIKWDHQQVLLLYEIFLSSFLTDTQNRTTHSQETLTG
jgi:hypothetical protein